MIYLGLGLILVELFIGIETGFDLVLIGIALIVGGGTGNLTSNWELGLLTTITLATAYILFGRKYIKDRLSTDLKPSNVDALKGATGTVTSDISPPQAGKIKVGSEEWRATSSQKLKKGDQVKVIKVEGVTAQVAPQAPNP